MAEPLICEQCETKATEIYSKPLAGGTVTFLFSFCRGCGFVFTGVVAGKLSPRWEKARSELAEAVFRQVAADPITWQEVSRFRANLRTDMIMPCALAAAPNHEIAGA